MSAHECSSSQHNFNTQRLHAEYNPFDHLGSIQVPVYQAAAFAMPSAQAGRDIAEGRQPGFTYSLMVASLSVDSPRASDYRPLSRRGPVAC